MWVFLYLNMIDLGTISGIAEMNFGGCYSCIDVEVGSNPSWTFGKVQLDSIEATSSISHTFPIVFASAKILFWIDQLTSCNTVNFTHAILSECEPSFLSYWANHGIFLEVFSMCKINCPGGLCTGGRGWRLSMVQETATSQCQNLRLWDAFVYVESELGPVRVVACYTTQHQNTSC